MSETEKDIEYRNAIAKHYDDETGRYLEILGDVLNASRPKNIHEMLDYVIEQSGMNGGMKIMDGGCGVCGPAIYFASKLNVDITGLNLSTVQLEIAKKKISAAQLQGSITLMHADFNNVHQIFAPETFDLIYFLEAFCYHQDTKEILQNLFTILKPGGILYMKDCFYKNDLRNVDLAKYDIIRERVNTQYGQQCNYENHDIDNVARDFERSAFQTLFVRKPLYENDGYTLYALFQKGYDLGAEMDDVFKVIDFYEIKAVKPAK